RIPIGPRASDLSHAQTVTPQSRGQLSSYRWHDTSPTSRQLPSGENIGSAGNLVCSGAIRYGRVAPRRGGRVVECAGLDSQSPCKPPAGSNPAPSATYTSAPPLATVGAPV